MEVDSLDYVWSIENFSNESQITELLSMRSKRFINFKIIPILDEKLKITAEFLDGTLPIFAHITIQLQCLGLNDEQLTKSADWEINNSNLICNFEFDHTPKELIDMVYIYQDEMMISIEIKLYESKIENKDTKTEENMENLNAEPKFSGLINQGATCYMNALLQSIYQIPYVRKLIFEKGPVDDKNEIYKAIREIFSVMQLRKTSVTTLALTDALDMSYDDLLLQQDIHEFSDVIKTALGQTIFVYDGKLQHYIKCLDVDESSIRVESFKDLSVVVQGVDNLEESFENYFAVDILNGENQYQTENHGLQDAEMGIKILECPKVLQIHLQRFEFDQQTHRNRKVNSKFEFEEKLDLSKYLSNDKPAKYELFQVVVHSGNPDFGHYYTVARPTKSEQWYKFNDTEVYKVSKEEAIDDNFGGQNNTNRSEKLYSAYLLIYIREDFIDEAFIDVPDEIIPAQYKKIASNLDTTILSMFQDSGLFSRRNSYQPASLPLGSLFIYSQESLQSDARRARCWLECCSAFIPNFNFSSITVQGMIDAISSVLGKSIDLYRLWTVKNGFPISYIDADTMADMNISELGEFDGIFIDGEFDEDNADDALKTDYVLVFVYSYDKSMNDPLRFHHSGTISIKKTVSEVIEDFIPSIRKYDVEYIMKDKSVCKASEDEAIGFLAEGKSAFIIATCLKPLTAKLFSDYNRKRPPLKSEPHVICSTRIEQPCFPDSAADFIRQEQNIVEVKCKHLTDVENIAFPFEINGDIFFDFLVSVFDVQDFDDEDIMLVYPDISSTEFVVIDTEKPIREQLSLDSIVEISFIIIPPSKVDDFRSLVSFDVRITKLGKSIDRKTVFVKSDATVKQLMNENICDDEHDYIPIAVKKHRIVDIIDENTEISAVKQPLVVEIPTILSDEIECHVHFIKDNDKIKFHGNPTIIKISNSFTAFEFSKFVDRSFRKQYEICSYIDEKIRKLDMDDIISQHINSENPIIILQEVR